MSQLLKFTDKNNSINQKKDNSFLLWIINTPYRSNCNCGKKRTAKDLLDELNKYLARKEVKPDD
jgi:hypothetical protein